MASVRFLASRLSIAKVLFALTLVAIGILTIAPLTMVLYGSLTANRPGQPFEGFTFEVLVRAYSSPNFWRAGLTTIAYSLGVTAIAVAGGTFLAWVVERTNAPLRNTIFLLSVVRLIIPGLLVTIAWILILGPNAGILNVWLSDVFALDDAPINIFSLPGMIFVEGLQTIPIPFLLMVAAFRSMDPSLEEVARTSGASFFAIASRVTFPLVRPAMFASVLIAFIGAFEGFETPALIGLRAQEPIRTFSTEIWLNVRTSPTDFNLASAYSLIFLLTAMILMFLYLRATRSAEQFATVTGRGLRPSRVDLGAWRWPTTLLAFSLVGLMFVVPVAALLWRSLQPFSNAPSLETLKLLTLDNWEYVLGLDLMWLGLRNSVLLALMVAAVVVVLCAVAAWLVTRARVFGRGMLDVLLFIPISMPGLVIGLAFFWFALAVVPLLYGTLLIIAFAHATKLLPYGMRFTSASMLQIHAELEAAAYASGANSLQTFRRIVVPLLMPGLIGAFIFVFIGSVRELSATVLLQGFDTVTFPVVLFERFVDGSPGQAAAVALVGVVVLGALVGVARLLSGRVGVRA